jgi:lipid-A-disaccharide synthase
LQNPDPSKSIMIVAGEASGDLHGAKLVEAMHERDPNLFFCGIGGPALRVAGMQVLVDAAELAVVGLTEVLVKAPALLKGLSLAKKKMRQLHPDLLILIDFPDFNLHLAGVAKKLGIPVLYYISPQIWAWRAGRVKKIKARVDHMAAILPFERAFYTQQGVPVTFVGHPLLDHPPLNKVTHSIPPVWDKQVIGLLPGSRDREIIRHLPLMLQAAERLHARQASLEFWISLAPGVARQDIEGQLARQALRAPYRIIEGGVAEICRQAQMVIAASGTVTLEAAIWGTPMIIIYKLSPLSFWLGRRLVRVNHIGLVNLIAGRELVPELVQAAASADNISNQAHAMLNDPQRLATLRRELGQIRDRLGGAGASRRVAQIAFNLMSGAHVGL